MFARCAPDLIINPSVYRDIHWECGMIGQVLYLEGEANGLRGTGMGCYYDNPTHSVFGMLSSKYQDLYHFTTGYNIEDARLQTLTAYESKELF